MFETWKKVAAAVPVAALLSGTCLFGAARLGAQETNPTASAPANDSNNQVTQGPNGVYIYHVKVVQRNLDSVNYVNRKGSTEIGFEGTSLMPGAKGEAKVSSLTGKTSISAHFEGLKPANGFGPEYLTYVLWAISSDGRPQNLGELELAGDKASLDVTTGFQAFGMIVTAEPYFAVEQPSDVVVLQNVFTDQTHGVLQHVDVHYQLLPRGLYASSTANAQTIPNPITDREHAPLALYEAYNAQRIADNTGAEKYAPEIMQRVAEDIKNAQQIQSSKHRDVKMEFTYAREAVERSEDARIVTLRKQAEERQMQQQASKEAAQQQAMQSQLQAAQAQAQADAAAAQAAQAQAAQAEAQARAAAAAAQANQANQRAAQSAASEQALRERLLKQLSAVLQTTETPRGLVIHMSDVLFNTNKYDLKPATQISLAKVATILELYPGLTVQVEGYTDSTGSPAYNQTLSENRADTVKNFLIQNGVPPNNVTAKGYGASNFVAPNDTAAGRAQNRRVDMIVSGDAIGVKTVPPSQSGDAGAAGSATAPGSSDQGGGTAAPNPSGTSNPPNGGASNNTGSAPQTGTSSPQ